MKPEVTFACKYALARQQTDGLEEQVRFSIVVLICLKNVLDVCRVSDQINIDPREGSNSNHVTELVCDLRIKAERVPLQGGHVSKEQAASKRRRGFGASVVGHDGGQGFKVK